MNKKVTILNAGTRQSHPSTPIGRVVDNSRTEVIRYLPETISTDPVVLALSAITGPEFLTEIEQSPVLGVLVQKYSKNWQGILTHRYYTNNMLAHIRASLFPDRIDRAGFDPGYIKILVYIQDKYLEYMKNSPN